MLTQTHGGCGALVVTLLLTACGGTDSTPTDTAVATTSAWRLARLGEKDVTTDARPTLEFTGVNTLAGFAGCNRFSASYRRNDQSLYVSALALTKKLCPEPAMQLERDFTAALEQAIGIRETAAALVIETEAPVASLLFDSAASQ